MYWTSSKRSAFSWLPFCAVLLVASWQGAAAEFTPADIGAGSSGSTVAASGGFDVSGTGRDIGGASDQFHFGYQERAGDFDLRVRGAAVTITDPFVQAGLIARDSLNSNAPFAGVFSSSAQLGCFFESRAAVGVNGSVLMNRYFKVDRSRIRHL